MSIQARIIAGLLIALALAAGAWRIHTQATTAERERNQGEQAQAALTESEARRNRERALSITNLEIERAHQMDKARLAADAAATADRLRSYHAAADRATSADPTAASGPDAPFAAIAGECARSLGTLGTHADGLAGTVRALQSYTASVCLAPP